MNRSGCEGSLIDQAFRNHLIDPDQSFPVLLAGGDAHQLAVVIHLEGVITLREIGEQFDQIRDALGTGTIALHQAGDIVLSAVAVGVPFGLVGNPCSRSALLRL